MESFVILLQSCSIESFLVERKVCHFVAVLFY